MSNYRVIVCGVKPGRTVDEVVEALSRVSMKPTATLRAVLDGRRVVVKRTPEVSRAARYKRILSEMGCVCTIEADVAASSPDTGVPAITVNFTATVDGRQQPSPAMREFVYPSRPKRWLLTRARVWMLMAVLMLVAWQGYATLVR